MTHAPLNPRFVLYQSAEVLPGAIHQPQETEPFPEGLVKSGGGASGWEPSGEGGVCSATPAAGRQAGLPATPPEQRQAVMWSPRPRRGSSVCLPPQTEQHTAGVSLKASPGLQDGFKMQTSARHARDCFTFMDCLRSSHDSNSNTKILMTHFLYRLVVEDTAGSLSEIPSFSQMTTRYYLPNVHVFQMWHTERLLHIHKAFGKLNLFSYLFTFCLNVWLCTKVCPAYVKVKDFFHHHSVSLPASKWLIIQHNVSGLFIFSKPLGLIWSHNQTVK